LNVSETGLLLAKIALLENRQATNETIMAWAEILERVQLHHALEALKKHYQQSTEPVKPAHIIKLVREIKDEEKKTIYADG
jgi:hypothetical protein